MEKIIYIIGNKQNKFDKTELKNKSKKFDKYIKKYKKCVDKTHFFLYNIACQQEWAHSSVGRASALQAGGHRFEPYCAHHFFGLVVQLVRTPPCHGGGRGFESHPGRHFFIWPDSSVGRAED